MSPAENKEIVLRFNKEFLECGDVYNAYKK